MTTTAGNLLNTLLDRYERQPECTRRVMEKAPLGFTSAADQSEFESVMAGTVSAGAVEIERGRGEIRHLICRIILKDAARLYSFLARTPRSQRAAEAADRLQAEFCPKAKFVRATAAYIRAGASPASGLTMTPSSVRRAAASRAGRCITAPRRYERHSKR